MYDFYTELSLFWENYGHKSDSLDWLGELQKNLKQIFFSFNNFIVWQLRIFQYERILSNSYSHVLNI